MEREEQIQSEMEAQLRRSHQLEEEMQKNLKTRRTSAKRRPERSTTRGDVSSSYVIDGSKSTEHMKKKEQAYWKKVRKYNDEYFKKKRLS